MLSSAGALLEDVRIEGGSQWSADDHVGWAVASYDGTRVLFVTTDTHSIYSVSIDAPHTVGARIMSKQQHAWDCRAEAHG